MATTFTIPLTTLPLGTQQFGPSHPADSESAILLTIDRTVAGGLNATPAAVIAFTVEQSNDGGGTWQLRVGGTMPGGLIPAGRGGGNLAASTLSVDLAPGTSRQLRASVTVTGSAVAVAGTLATS